MSFLDAVGSLKEKMTVFKGETVQTVGIIPKGVDVSLKLDSSHGILSIVYTKTQTVTLVYERILGFTVECVKTYEDNRVSNMAGQFLSSGLAGSVGKIVGGGLVGRQKEIIRWIGTLYYTDKNGERSELRFIEKNVGEYYTEETKTSSAKKFETAVNQIAAMVGGNLTEL